MTIILADLGGTHLRLAHAETPSDIQFYKIAEHPSFDALLKSFAPNISALYLASAIQPRGGIIQDKRFGNDSHWSIDLNALNVQKVTVLNDLEAAAHALGTIRKKDLHEILPATKGQIHFDHPPKLLIGIGTGIGHAYLFEKQGHVPFVQRTHGGHVPALALSDEQKEIVTLLSKRKTHDRDLIVEDIVSGHGYKNLNEIVSEENALRLFWEFLGLYSNTLIGLSGAYGGLYLTGGTLTEMYKNGKFMPESFAQYFHRPLVPVVVETMEAVPIYYCLEPNMPMAGLAAYAGFHA